MAITENFGPELDEYKQQLPVTITHHRIMYLTNDYLRRNQQDKPNSSCSTIRTSNESTIRLSNKDNLSSYFRSSNKINQRSTSAVAAPVIEKKREQICQRRGHKS